MKMSEIAKAVGVSRTGLAYYITKDNLREKLDRARDIYYENLYPVGDKVGHNTIIAVNPGRPPMWKVQCECGISKPRWLTKGGLEKKMKCEKCFQEPRKAPIQIGDRIGNWEIVGEGPKIKRSARRVQAKCLLCKKVYIRQLPSLRINQGVGCRSCNIRKVRQKYIESA